MAKKKKPKELPLIDILERVATVLDRVTDVIERQAAEGARSSERSDRFESPVYKKSSDERTQEMFAELSVVRLPHSTKIFIDDLRESFEFRGYISYSQYKCLERNYNKFINGTPFRT